MSIEVALSDDQVGQLRGLEERLASAQSATMSRLQGSDNKMDEEMRDMQENLFSARWYAMNEQINAFINENAEIRNAVGEMRNELRVVQTALRRGLQGLEDLLGREREDLENAIRAESDKRIAGQKEFEQSFEQLRNRTEKVAEVGTMPAELEGRLQALQRGLDQEAAQRASGDEHLAQLAQEVSNRLQELSEVLRQRMLDPAMDVPYTSRDSRPGSGSSLSPPAKGSADADFDSTDVNNLRQEVATERKKRVRDRESISQQLKELRLCLEAEVGARSAANERLDRQVHDVRSDFTTALNERAGDDKADAQRVLHLEQAIRKEIQLLQGSFQQQTTVISQEVAARKAGEDKLRRSLELEGQQRDNSDLQLGVLRESFTLLEKDMKTRATRQDVEKSIGALTKQLSHEVQGRLSGDEDLKQFLLGELREQANFFSSEMKNLLSTAHHSFSDELRKLKTFVKTEHRDSRSFGDLSEPSPTGTGSIHMPASNSTHALRSNSYESSGSFPPTSMASAPDANLLQRAKVQVGSATTSCTGTVREDSKKATTPVVNQTPPLPVSQRLPGMGSGVFGHSTPSNEEMSKHEAAKQTKLGPPSSSARSFGSSNVGSSNVQIGEVMQNAKSQVPMAEARRSVPSSPPPAHRTASPRRSPRLTPEEQRKQQSQMFGQAVTPTPSAQPTPTRSAGGYNMETGSFRAPAQATGVSVPTPVQGTRVVPGRHSTGTTMGTSKLPFAYSADK